MTEEGQNPNNVLPKIYSYLFLQKSILKMSMMPLKWLILSAILFFILLMFFGWMSMCSSWCEQLIATFVERIGVILIVLHSLCESRGPMGPRGPAIWFICEPFYTQQANVTRLFFLDRHLWKLKSIQTSSKFFASEFGLSIHQTKSSWIGVVCHSEHNKIPI